MGEWVVGGSMHGWLDGYNLILSFILLLSMSFIERNILYKHVDFEQLSILGHNKLPQAKHCTDFLSITNEEVEV